MLRDYRLNRTVWAAGFVLVGVLLLLFNFDQFARYEPFAQYLLAALLAAGASGFFLSYFAAKKEWARLIPAWTLLALAGMVIMSTITAIDQRMTAALLFGGLAAAFANIYLLNRLEHWWAIIPSGFMLVLGLVIALSSLIERLEALATILFVGMGLVFFAVYWLAGARRHWWALVPGLVLTIFGLFVFSLDAANAEGTLPVFRWWPILLILIGVVIGLLGYRQAPRARLTVNSAPAHGVSKAKNSPRSESSSAPPHENQLGDYSRPAPGATVEILPDPDDLR
ncbi:MAG: hypothetical protein KDD78_03495 [Caldilineaceae bacterium]|nr:hypothetical protein [Caldilineaceae bacterium]